MELRDYQRDLIDKARAEMAAGHRTVLIVAPCGAGKTVLSAFMAGQCVQRGGRVLFLAHRKELLDQSEATFRRAGINLDNIDIMSIQTATRRVDRLPPYRMVICDECHHAAAASYRKVLDSMPDSFIVGLTATPVRTDGKGLGDVFERMVQGIDTAELIRRGFLADYRCFNKPLIDRSKLKTRIGDFTAESIEMEAARNNVYGKAVELYRKLVDGRQAIVYCASINHSQSVLEAFRQTGINAAHLDACTPKDERAAIIERFRTGDIKVLTNVDLLGEGFDVPSCDAVILQRPTKSLALHIQQSMRSMRPAPGKTAYIIDCVGNINAHCLPDEYHAWTLDGKTIMDHGAAERDRRMISCPNCGFVNINGKGLLCVFCGSPLHDERDRAINEVDAQLTELTKDERSHRIMRSVEEARKKRREEADCASYDDLIKLAKERGYKPGWAYYRARARGYV